MATIESLKLEDIARAVADELQLTTDDSISISQVTVAVTYSVNRQDFIDEWYEDYLAKMTEDTEVPF